MIGSFIDLAAWCLAGAALGGAFTVSSAYLRGPAFQLAAIGLLAFHASAWLLWVEHVPALPAASVVAALCVGGMLLWYFAGQFVLTSRERDEPRVWVAGIALFGLVEGVLGLQLSVGDASESAPLLPGDLSSIELMVVLATCQTLFVVLALTSRWGRVWRAVWSNPAGAMSLGIPARRIGVVSLLIAAGGVGLASALLMTQVPNLQGRSDGELFLVVVLAMFVLGMARNVVVGVAGGAVIAAFLFQGTATMSSDGSVVIAVGAMVLALLSAIASRGNVLTEAADGLA